MEANEMHSSVELFPEVIHSTAQLFLDIPDHFLFSGDLPVSQPSPDLGATPDTFPPLPAVVTESSHTAVVASTTPLFLPLLPIS